MTGGRGESQTRRFRDGPTLKALEGRCETKRRGSGWSQEKKKKNESLKVIEETQKNQCPPGGKAGARQERKQRVPEPNTTKKKKVKEKTVGLAG